MSRTTLLSFGFLFLCAVWALSPPLSSAQEGPAVTGGSYPYQSWTGTVSPFVTDTFYTVPTGTSLVLTNICVGGNHYYADLMEGSTMRVEGNTRVFRVEGGLLCAGEGTVPFTEGASVGLQYWPTNVSDPPITYYVEGYLAHP